MGRGILDKRFVIAQKRRERAAILAIKVGLLAACSGDIQAILNGPRRCGGLVDPHHASIYPAGLERQLAVYETIRGTGRSSRRLKENR